MFGLLRYGLDVVVGVAGPADEVAGGAYPPALVVGWQVGVGLEQVRRSGGHGVTPVRALSGPLSPASASTQPGGTCSYSAGVTGTRR